MTSDRVTFKMVLLGEGSVGKTAIRLRYLGKGFQGTYNMTLGADFAMKRIEIGDTLFVTQIWDLAGQTGFMKTRKMYYGGAMAGLLVFDINRPKTFERLNVWIDEIQDNTGELFPLVLIGNKSDLRGESDEQVSVYEAQKYALELTKKIGYKVPYIETSALEGKNIEDAFTALVKKVYAIINGELERGEFEEGDLELPEDTETASQVNFKEVTIMEQTAEQEETDSTESPISDISDKKSTEDVEPTPKPVPSPNPGEDRDHDGEEDKKVTSEKEHAVRKISNDYKNANFELRLKPKRNIFATKANSRKTERRKQLRRYGYRKV